MVQGDCAEAPTDADVAVIAETAGAVALLPLQPRQCLVLAYEDFLPVLSTRCALPPSVPAAADPEQHTPHKQGPWQDSDVHRL